MKKILLTTTALVMTAGVAAAEVSFSGKAQVALTDDNGAHTAGTTEYQLTTGLDFDVNISAATDNGITMSTSFDMGLGELVDYDDDDAIESQGPLTDAESPELTIGWNGYTISAQQDGVDNLYNDDLTGDDLGISGAMGGVSFAVTTDLERDSSSVKLEYAMGDLTATYTQTNDDNGDTAGKDAASKIALSYKMGDITMTASTDDKGDADSENKVGFSYTMDDVTVSYTSIDPSAAGKDMGDEWDASIKYSAGSLTASLATDETDATTLIAEYDLGGGATFFAASHNKDGEANDLNTMGINFTF